MRLLVLCLRPASWVRSRFVIGASVVLLALVLASCSPAATPSPTEKVTAPAATAPATTAAQPAAPIVTPATSQAAVPSTTQAAKPAAVVPAGSFTLVKGALRGENWLCPDCDVGSIQNMAPLMESLLERDMSTGQWAKPGGRLAERWEASPDYQTYTFQLRKGVQFHDGWGELTAEDVKFSFELATRDKSRNPSLTQLRSLEIEVVDPYKFVFRAKNPYLSLPRQLGEMPLNFPITSKKYITTVGEAEATKHPIGTGPFKFKGHEPGVSVTFEAVPNHWRKTPAIKTVTIKAVAEANTRLSMVRAGQADFTSIGSFDQIPEVAAAGLQVIALKNQSLPGLYFLGNYVKPAYPEAARPPWADPDPAKALKVRQALSLAIDREEIVKSIFRGRGTTEGACVQGFQPTSPGFDKSCKSDPYDPERAKRLLAEAGYKNPADLQFTMDVARHSLRTWNGAIAEAIAQMWRAMGINVKTQQSEYARVEQLAIARSANFAFIYPAPASPIGAEFLGYFTRTTDRLSYTGESAELDGLVNKAFAAATPEEQDMTNRAVFDYVRQNALGVPVAHADLIFAANPKLKWQTIPGTDYQHDYNFEFMSFGN